MLDTLRQKLERDYQLLSYLLNHSPALHTGSDGFEQVMMMLDFNLMKAFYSTVSLLSRSGRPSRASGNVPGGQLLRQYHGRARRLDFCYRVAAITNTWMTSHETRFRVRYAETDQMGVVYYANYLIWMEVGRAEYCRASGIPYKEMEVSDGIRLAVVDGKALPLCASSALRRGNCRDHFHHVVKPQND